MPLLAHVFEEEGALDRLEAFASLNGPAFYRLPVNDGTITLVKQANRRSLPRKDPDRGRPRHRLQPRLPRALACRKLISSWRKYSRRRLRGQLRTLRGEYFDQDEAASEGPPMIPTTFPPREEIARLTARALLEIKAVHFNAETPFTLASGLPSPTYIDCRKLISYPRIRVDPDGFPVRHRDARRRVRGLRQHRRAARPRASPSPRWWPNAWPCR